VEEQQWQTRTEGSENSVENEVIEAAKCHKLVDRTNS